jgi:hypothetical protein
MDAIEEMAEEDMAAMDDYDMINAGLDVAFSQ